jgi:hypothetical protein
MIGATKTGWCSRLLVGGFAAAFALVALVLASPPAKAGVFVSVGIPFPGCCYGPGPYYGYPPPPAYYSPPGYYPPPPNYGSAGTYPPPNAGAPSAYAPGSPTPGYASPSTGPAATGSPAITYTNKPAFTNAAGQTCRQYKTTDATSGHPVDVYGTACRQADGQWRVVD